MTAAVSRVVEEPEGDSAEPPPVETARRTPGAIRAAGFGILAIAASWALHDVAWQRLLGVMTAANPLWITLAAGLYLTAVYTMAGRWRAVLHPLAPLVTQVEAFKAMIMGFAVSTVVPARGGELARAEWLGRRTGLPRATILGSIVLDHLVNAAGMFTGIAVLPALLDLPGWLHSGIWLALTVFAVAASAVFLLRPKAGLPTPDGAEARGGRVGAAVAGFLVRARLGLTAVRDRRALARSYGASLLAWLLELQVILVTLHAFDIHVPLGVELLVLMAVNLALVVPFAPPANLGTVEFGATIALMEYGVPKEQALAFALVYHFLQVIPIGIGGLALASRSLLRHMPLPESTRP
jgi:uncharacterized protein (TIRG00374 family)